MDEVKYKDSIESDEDFSDSLNQTTVSNCFESSDHIKSDDGEVANQTESYLTGDLESIDLNDTSNDCSEKNSPDMMDSPSSCTTGSPSSVHSQSQASKKKK